jgi:hypothetical protein
MGGTIQSFDAGQAKVKQEEKRFPLTKYVAFCQAIEDTARMISFGWHAS